MKENKKKKSLVLIIVILGILLLGTLACLYFGYQKYNDLNNENKINSAKLENIEKESNIYNTKEKRFKIYADNLKKEMSEKYNKYTVNEEIVKSMFLESYDIGYLVKLDNDGKLSVKYFDEKKERKIATNVLNFYVIQSGQGGGNTLYFINADGTVGFANTEYGFVENRKVEVVNKVDNLKYIINIVGCGFSDGASGAWGAMFIDVDGNILKK